MGVCMQFWGLNDMGAVEKRPCSDVVGGKSSFRRSEDLSGCGSFSEVFGRRRAGTDVWSVGSAQGLGIQQGVILVLCSLKIPKSQVLVQQMYPIFWCAHKLFAEKKGTFSTVMVMVCDGRTPPGVRWSRSPTEFLQGLAPEDFNLAQMLQGENVPASVFQLQVGIVGLQRAVLGASQ